MFKTLGLLAAIKSFIDMFLVDEMDGPNTIFFYDAKLLMFPGRFFIESNGIFFDVWNTNFVLFDDSSGGGSLIIFVDFDLLKSYFGFGNC